MQDYSNWAYYSQQQQYDMSATAQAQGVAGQASGSIDPSQMTAYNNQQAQQLAQNAFMYYPYGANVQDIGQQQQLLQQSQAQAYNQHLQGYQQVQDPYQYSGYGSTVVSEGCLLEVICCCVSDLEISMVSLHSIVLFCVS